MKRLRYLLLLPALVLPLAGCPGMLTTELDPLRWERLPTLPDALGFGGPFAGTTDGVLVVAGGANFPVSLFEGGEKVWRDKVFVLARGSAGWAEAGTLARPLAYGGSVSHRDGLILLGGCDARQCYADVVRLNWRDDKLVARALPKLPKPCAYTCCALVDNVVYVAGGQATNPPTATMKNFWALDLTRRSPRWEVLDPWPGPSRHKGVAASFRGAFYLFGGNELLPGAGGKVAERYLTDAYRYRPGTGWEKLPDLPRPVTAAPTPARQHERRYVMVLGGSDGSYSGPPRDHPGFSRQIQGLDAQTGSWVDMGTLPAPRVTTATVLWNGLIVVPSGEVRPGVRSPEVHAARPWKEKRLKTGNPLKPE